jgi:uncharacterized protein YqeY
MSILERLNEDMNRAAKARDSERLGAIRFMRAQTKNREIELGRELEDDDVIEVLSRVAKQHRETIDQSVDGGRDEMAERERRLLAVVEEYLPEKLSGDELAGIVSEAIEETGASGPRDMGKVMKAVMPRVRGRAEGAEVKNVVLSRLSGSEDDAAGQ